MSGPVDDVRALVRHACRPRWTVWVAASALALAVAVVEYNAWTTTYGQQGSLENRYIWPWLRWQWGSATIGGLPPAGLLTWNYLTGVAIWYLPVALVDRTARTGIARLAAFLGDGEPTKGRATAFVSTLGLRRSTFERTLAFAVVGSWLPPWFLSIFTFPGFLAMAFVTPAMLPFERYEVIWQAFRPAFAFLIWYAVLGGVAALARRYGWSRPQSRDPDEDVRLGGRRRSRR